MSSKYSLHLTPIALAVFLANSQSALADNNVYHQDTITVIGTLDSDPITQSQAISALDRKDIESLSAKGMTDALAQLPNVDVIGGPSSASKNISIRGLPQSHAYVSIDGIYQSNYASKRGSWYLNPFMVQTLQVTNGPTSGAAAGKISIKTLSAKDLLKEGQQSGLQIGGGYRSNNEQKDTNLAVYGVEGDLDWLFAANYMDKEPYKIGNGDSYYKTSARDTSLMAKVGNQFSDDRRLELSWHYDDAHGHQVRNDIGNRDVKYNGASLVWTDKASSNDLVDLTASVYLNNVDSQSWELDDEAEGVQEIKDNSLGFSVSNNSQVSFKTPVIFHYGLSGHVTDHDGSIYKTDLVTGIVTDESAESEASTTSYKAATWVNAQISITDNLDITPGVRFDQYSIKSSNAVDSDGNLLLKDARKEDRVSKSLSINYYLNENIKLYTAYAEALNNPGNGDLFTSGRGFKPNPNLKSERADNKEIGATFSFQDGLTEGDEWDSRISVFRNDVKDYIGTEYTDPEYHDGVKVNIGQVRLEGIEVSTRYKLNDWMLNAAYGSVRGKDQSTGWYISDMPSDKLKLTAEYQYDRSLTLGGRLTHALAHNNAPTEQITSGGGVESIPSQAVGSWSTLDLYARYTPDALPALTVSASVTNLFNENYGLRSEWQRDGTTLESPETYYEEGRSINLSANYRF